MMNKDVLQQIRQSAVAEIKTSSLPSDLPSESRSYINIHCIINVKTTLLHSFQECLLVLRCDEIGS